MNVKFVSHARTPEQLRDEVCSDLQRRIAQLNGYAHSVAKNATEKARLAAIAQELVAMLEFWQNVEIVRPKRVPREAEQAQ